MFQKIVIINGKGKAGKDTFVKMCNEQFENVNIENISTVDYVKKIVSYIIETNKKTEKERKLISELNHALNEYNWEPLRRTANEAAYNILFYKQLKENCIIFIHCREPEYIEKLKELISEKKHAKEVPIETLLIRNPNVPDITSNESDKNVENYTYDVIIDNDGTLDDLKEKAKIYMEYCIEGFSNGKK